MVRRGKTTRKMMAHCIAAVRPSVVNKQTWSPFYPSACPTTSKTPAGELGVEKFRVAAKANPWYKEDASCDFFTPTYGLRPDLVKEQLRKSIKTLGYVMACSLSVL